MESFQRLRKSAKTISGLAAVIMALSWLGAFVSFLFPKYYLASPALLFATGAIIGVLGEALSRIMDAFADHMEDTHAVKEDMDRLMKRIERK